jgi:parvulin-like peptidyl-prolyl isomerase
MAKKQKKATSERAPTKHQLSKWQRQMKIRRIVIIAAVVFLVGIASWVGYGYYKDYKSNPLRQVVIEVNGVSFTMEYYVKMLDAYTAGINSTVLSSYGNYFANIVADDIIDAELLRQGAKNLNIAVNNTEIDAKLKEYGLSNDKVYRDIITADLLQEKLKEHFGSNLTDTMEQADVQVMLVKSQEVADEVIAKVEAGGNSTNFTALAQEFSCNSSVEGDLGWLPEELMPNTLIANAAFNLTPGNISQPIYDKTAIKDVGYWLIEVTAKQDDAINASVMLLGSEAEAEQVKAQLAAGGNFSALAGNYSQHASNTTGGKLDGLKRGAMNSTAFDAVAFNLTLNKISEPVKDTSVQTTGGYWLVEVIDRGDHEVSDSIKQQLIDKHYNDWRKEWSDKSTIETYLEADKISWAINKVLAGR